jgi:hypothetical protein
MDLTTNGIVVRDAIKYVQVKSGSPEYCRKETITGYQRRQDRKWGYRSRED